MYLTGSVQYGAYSNDYTLVLIFPAELVLSGGELHPPAHL